MGGLEPPRPKSPAPQADASTNSATFAFRGQIISILPFLVNRSSVGCFGAIFLTDRPFFTIYMQSVTLSGGVMTPFMRVLAIINITWELSFLSGGPMMSSSTDVPPPSRTSICSSSLEWRAQLSTLCFVSVDDQYFAHRLALPPSSWSGRLALYML